MAASPEGEGEGGAEDPGEAGAENSGEAGAEDSGEAGAEDSGEDCGDGQDDIGEDIAAKSNKFSI